MAQNLLSGATLAILSFLKPWCPEAVPQAPTTGSASLSPASHPKHPPHPHSLQHPIPSFPAPSNRGTFETSEAAPVGW